MFQDSHSLKIIIKNRSLLALSKARFELAPSEEERHLKPPPWTARPSRLCIGLFHDSSLLLFKNKYVFCVVMKRRETALFRWIPFSKLYLMKDYAKAEGSTRLAYTPPKSFDITPGSSPHSVVVVVVWYPHKFCHTTTTITCVFVKKWAAKYRSNSRLYTRSRHSIMHVSRILLNNHEGLQILIHTGAAHVFGLPTTAIACVLVKEWTENSLKFTFIHTVSTFNHARIPDSTQQS